MTRVLLLAYFFLPNFFDPNFFLIFLPENFFLKNLNFKQKNIWPNFFTKIRKRGGWNNKKSFCEQFSAIFDQFSETFEQLRQYLAKKYVFFSIKFKRFTWRLHLWFYRWSFSNSTQNLLLYCLLDNRKIFFFDIFMAIFVFYKIRAKMTSQKMSHLLFFASRD